MLRALGPLFVCILSIVLMNIFKWYQVGGRYRRGTRHRVCFCWRYKGGRGGAPAPAQPNVG